MQDRTNLTPKQERYKAYFQALIDELREVHRFTGRRTAQPVNYFRFSSREIRGISYGAHFPEGDKVAAYVYIDENVQVNRLDLFDALAQRKKEIESDFGSPLEFRDRIKTSKIIVSRDENIWLSDDDLKRIREWHIKNLLELKKVFEPYIQQALETLNSNE